jgi:hypothetical protein
MNCPRFDGEIVLEEFAHPALADKGESARTGYRRLQKALVGTAFHLVKGKATEKAVSQVRKAVGYSTQRTKGGWIWVKIA